MRLVEVGEKSPSTHTIRTKNQFKVTQHSVCCFRSSFPSEVDTDTIIRAWCDVVDNAGHDERL